MKNILKAEFFKLKKSKTVLICGIILGAYAVLTAALYLLIFGLASGGEGGFFTADLSLVLFSSGFQVFMILTTVVICSFYSGEYRQGIIRNSLCAGVSRSRVYLAKFITAMIITAAVYVLVTLFFLTAFGIAFGWGSTNAGAFVGFWFLGLLLYASIGALAFMFSVMTKSTGATIGISIGISVFANIFSVISLIVLLAGEGSNVNVVNRIITEIFLLLPTSQLTLAASMSLEGWRIAEAAAVGVAFLAGAYFGGLALFNKQDQK